MALIICWLVILVICVQVLSSLPDCKLLDDKSYAWCSSVGLRSFPGLSAVLCTMWKISRHTLCASGTWKVLKIIQLGMHRNWPHLWLSLQPFKVSFQFLISIDTKSRGYIFLRFPQYLISRDLKSRCYIFLHWVGNSSQRLAVAEQGWRSYNDPWTQIYW